MTLHTINKEKKSINTPQQFRNNICKLKYSQTRERSVDPRKTRTNNRAQSIYLLNLHKIWQIRERLDPIRDRAPGHLFVSAV